MNVSRSAFRKERNYALAVASERFAPLLRAAARASSHGSPTSPDLWRRGLIVGHSHVGDVLYRTCSLDRLHAGLPECRWDYLTSPPSAPLLRNNPALHSVLPFTSSDDSARVSAASLRLLRESKYDVVLCTNTVRHVGDFALAALIGARNRVGFGNKGFSGLLTTPVQLEYPQPLPAYFRSLVAAVLGVAPDWPLEPRVYPGEEHRARAESFLHERKLDGALPVIACTVTTRQIGGAWPPQFFADVLSRALEHRAFNIVLFGGAHDEDALESVADAIRAPTHVSAGELDWLSFAEVLRRCDALLAMDSGPRHLANAVGTPVAFTRNLAFSRVEARAYCANEVDLAPVTVEGLKDSEIDALVSKYPIDLAAERLLSILRRQ